MTSEKKRKLRNIAILALLGLIGGTFAFQAFNQQAINDRLRENPADYGGRVHDYYHSDTENKDIFVENFGQEPIMVRLKLSEFMEIQERGSTSWRQVAGGRRDDLDSWIPYIPEANNVSQRRSDNPSAAFNQYSDLTFGWTRGGQDAPWYLPTFNTAWDNPITAAVGHARDLSYRLENGELYPRATHPGSGEDGYWSEGETYPNTGQWPGATIQRETAQNLIQDKAPITLQEWHTRYRGTPDAIGNYWVIDHETGWAYWANQLNGGQATSYLIDAAHMRPEANEINGSYYYGIHVSSELISLDQRFQDEPATGAVREFLEAISNPPSDVDAPIGDFNFSRMRPGRLFTTSEQQFRYLGNMRDIAPDWAEGSDRNHMIILNQPISVGTNGGNQAQRVALDKRYDEDFLPEDPELRAQWEGHVAPVASDFNVGEFPSWRVTNGPNGTILGLLTSPHLFYPFAEDITAVVAGGERRAFSLSVADVNLLTVIGSFANTGDRGAGIPWWLRTLSEPGWSWNVASNGVWNRNNHLITNRGIRPALIIHQ